MNKFEETLKRLHDFCEKESVEYAVIGGIAVITYDYERSTKDIDITVLCKLEELGYIHKKFVKQYLPIYNDSLNFFIRNFVLPLKDKVTEIKIDVAAGLTIFDDTIIRRRKRVKLGEVEFYICSLEDLILYKLFANRPQDIADTHGLITKNRNLIDKDYLLKTAEKFIELEREDIIESLKKILKE